MVVSICRCYKYLQHLLLQDGASVYDGDHGGGGDSRSDKGDIQVITPVFQLVLHA